jgi:protein-tyrosine phosphatase
MAEAVFQQLVDEAGLAKEIEVDSAGTGSWHVGEAAHPGTRRVLAKNGISYSGRARKIDRRDLSDESTYIIVMDENNARDVKYITHNHDRIYRLLEFSSQAVDKDVPDPYYEDNFDLVYNLVVDGCRGLLKAIRGWEQI